MGSNEKRFFLAGAGGGGGGRSTSLTCFLNDLSLVKFLLYKKALKVQILNEVALRLVVRKRVSF